MDNWPTGFDEHGAELWPDELEYPVPSIGQIYTDAGLIGTITEPTLIQMRKAALDRIVNWKWPA